MDNSNIKNDIKLKFKVVWCERYTEHDGFGDEEDSYYNQKSVIIFAQNEDEACDIWERDYSNDGCNGVESIELVIEHSLLDQSIIIPMVDDNTYLIPIRFIAKDHAEAHAHKAKMTSDEYLVRVTLPLFENNESQIIGWATKNIGWDKVRRVAQAIPKEPKIEEMQTAWQRGMGASIAPLEFNDKSLKRLSAVSINKLLSEAMTASGDDGDFWVERAKGFLAAYMPMLVKMRDINWYPITINSLLGNMSFFDVINYAFSKGHNYPIDKSEYEQLTKPIIEYVRSLPNFDESVVFKEEQPQTAEDHHQYVLVEISKALAKLVSGGV